jgi:hypothetical protein
MIPNEGIISPALLTTGDPAMPGFLLTPAKFLAGNAVLIFVQAR